jgi:hypothetical protein
MTNVVEKGVVNWNTSQPVNVAVQTRNQPIINPIFPEYSSIALPRHLNFSVYYH